MAIQNLSASVSGAGSVSASLKGKWGLAGIATGDSYSLSEMSFAKTGLAGVLSGMSFSFGRLSSKFPLGTAQADGDSAVGSAQLGAQRARTFGSNPCDFFWMEADGTSAGSELQQFRSRWQRHILDEDSIEWTEGKNLFMSSTPTTIINPGAPLTGSASSQLWIDHCSYNPSVAWPASGNKNVRIDAAFSGDDDGFTLESNVENPAPDFGGYLWSIPSRTYTAQFTGANRFEIRLADNSNTRGLRLGYAYKLWSDRISTTQSGTWTEPFSFLVPETVEWHLEIDYYIKTACDFDDPAQERNVAFIHHSTNFTTQVFIVKVNGIDKIVSNLMHTTHYYDMDKNAMDKAMEAHIDALWEKLDNFTSPEESWQMYPIRLDNISMNIMKQNHRIDFQLSNQYPVLTYTDPFVDRILNVSLDSESPATITQSSSSTPI
ncbi:MAG: hypothetical protein ACOY3I_01120 [Verrucomicrobiota bacterium]